MRTFAQKQNQPKTPTFSNLTRPNMTKLPHFVDRNDAFSGHKLTQNRRLSETFPQVETLPSGITESMQRLFGFDFSNVRISRNDADVAVLGASALTHGEHIRFAPGQFRPDHPRGFGLIGHELAGCSYSMM